MTVMCLLLLVMICVGLTGGAVKIGLQELYEGAPFFIWLLVGRRKRGRNDQG